MKKLLSVALLLIVSFVSVAPNVKAIVPIPEGAIIKTGHNPDVYIVKYKNGKQFKRLVLNPQVFESYGHLRWEDILTVSQSEINSFATSSLVRVDGQTDIYQLAPNGDIGNKHLLVSTDGYDLDSAYTINGVDFGNYVMGGVKGAKEIKETIKYTTAKADLLDLYSHQVIYVASINTKVVIIEEDLDWSHVKINDQEGWIESRYLSINRSQELDSEDNDNDGLKNWEEDQKGTDKNNSDTDGDGIVDGLDSHPVSGGRLIAQHFEWDYQGSHWTWDCHIHSDWYDYYRDKPRVDHGAEYVTYDDHYIQEIADMLTETADKKGYSKSEFAVAFIQSLDYVKDDVIGYNDHPKYPLETLAEQNGDCEDTSYLVSAIVKAMGISNVLVELPGHMAVAIAFSESPEGYYYRLSNGWDYYYIETTAKGSELGVIPDKYKNTKAKLVKIPSNEIEEKSPSYIPFTNNTPTPSQNDSQKSEELERSKKALRALEQLLVLKNEADGQLNILSVQIEEKNVEIENVENMLVSMTEINRELAKLIPEYNSLIEQYNVYLEIRSDLVSVAGKVSDYGKYGIPLSYKDKSFLQDLGINL